MRSPTISTVAASNGVGQLLPASLMARAYVSASSGCWLWLGALTSEGYGRVRWKKRQVYVHRLAYAIVHGRVPSGKLVCHKCDVRECFNPAHLQSGSHSTNLRHQYQRGRRKPKEVVP